jgi:DNA-binding response OmpR family regulator
VRTTAPDLIIADVNGTTLGLLDWLRDADSSLCAAATDTPVIVLTSNSEEVHRVRLLERGGDDVLVKPFCYPELPARIAAVLRRTAPRQPRRVLTAGPVRIDLRDRSVSVNERLVDLTANEYRLLCQLAAEPTRVLTKVNFETKLGKARGREGFRGLGAELLNPSPRGEARAA